MNRPLVRFLVLVVLIGLVGGCAPMPAPPATTVEVTRVVEQSVEKVVTATPVPPGKRDKIIFSALGDATQIFDNPWYTLVQEYNSAHPEVEVVMVGGMGFDALATTILAGNAPDLIHGAISPLFGRVPEMPNSVDVTKWLTPEDIADYGPAIEALRNPIHPDQIVGFPVELQIYPQICANIDVFEKAGIDWMKIRKDGWTWDEFIAAAQKLTVDKNGKHPTDAGFDPANIQTWGWGTGGEALAEQVYLAMMNNGLPQYAGYNATAVGSVWDLKGPLAVEAAQWVYDWLYKYQITDPTFRAWGDAQRMLRLQMQVQGQIAMTNEYGCATALARYNDAVDKGELAGTKLETHFHQLPLPYNDKNMKSELYSVLPIHLQVMKQDPYKGDQHTENVIAFAKWFTSAETQIHLCKDISAGACTVPARKSVRDAIITDPQAKAELEYIVARAKASPAMIHPAEVTIDTQIKLPAAEKMLAKEMTPQEMVDTVATQAQAQLDDWVNKTTEKDKALVQLWCTIPSWYPGSFYPNYKPPVSAACEAKVKELGIQ